MHHILRCRGLTDCSANRRRTVSRDSLASDEPGRCGRNRVECAAGTVREMGGQDHRPSVGSDDVFVLETLSGRGYGSRVEPEIEPLP